MITAKDFYNVLVALVPLYVTMILGYGSVRWWKIFTPDQCSGINRFVAVFAVPFLSFHFISTNNLYMMNYQFIVADSLQKVVVLFLLFVWQAFERRGKLDWMITLYSLLTLPNTLVLGVPLLKAMYGDFTTSLIIQIVVLQGVVWYTILLIMFEYRAAMQFISRQFPETVATISSLKIDSDVVSLVDGEEVEANAIIDDGGKLHVIVRRSNFSSSMLSSFSNSHGLINSLNFVTPRASNLTGVEIFSTQSSTAPTPRASSFDQIEVPAMPSIPIHRATIGGFVQDGLVCDVHLVQSSRNHASAAIISGSTYVSCENKELHMFVWSSSMSTNSSASSKYPMEQYEVNSRINSTEFGLIDASKASVQHEIATTKEIDERCQRKQHQMPPKSVMMRLILTMVWRKLIRNPNTYASILGLAWSLISFRWKIQTPSIVNGSVLLLSNAGLGMAMFSLGLFMALQPKIIACGKFLATIAMVNRFFIGPAIMAATSAAVGIRGDLLRVAIIQAVLPQGIVPFVFAREYKLHADILSTAVIFGMVVALPVTVLYYVLFQL